MKLDYKSFILSSNGESNGGQDALKCLPDTGLFAVADGVTNSFLPESVSKTLCATFVGTNPDELADWERYCSAKLLPAVKKSWNKDVETTLNTLSGRALRHEKIRLELWNYGASTFCGIHLDTARNLLHYFILGDSTLFVSHTDGTTSSFCSSPKITNEKEIEVTDYSNSTAAIISDGSIVGNWLVGTLPLEDISTISLMTDGMSKWFQSEQIDNAHPFDTLWNIADDEAFKTFASEKRNKGFLDDDLSVILIKINCEEDVDVSHEEVPKANTLRNILDKIKKIITCQLL